MDIMAKIAAAKAKAKQQKAEALAKSKPRYRVRNGKIVLRMRAVLAKPKPASNVHQLLPKEQPVHKLGDTCPHCLGRKRYSWHTSERSEKCYRCHGKGFLDARDLAYLAKRQQENRPICHIVTAGEQCRQILERPFPPAAG